jgi:RND family efflux transporter MFP subunit
VPRPSLQGTGRGVPFYSLGMISFRAIVAVVALVGGLSGSVGARQTSPDLATFGGIKAPVRASRDATLSFTFPAEVSKVLVKGGQRVKQGELLIQSKDEEARAQRDLQQSQAESDLDVQKAQTGVDQAQVEFDGWKKMDKKTAGSEIEYERARTLLAARKVELDIAKLQRAQAKIQLALRQAQLDRYAINAPFDGVIDNVMVEVGEVKKDTEPVLKIVSTDPLWMDVMTGTDQTITLGLKPGDKAWVVLELPGETPVHLGRVIEVGAEADFASATRRVRVELGNADNWPAGIQAWVRFTEPEGEWAKRIAGPRKADAGGQSYRLGLKSPEVIAETLNKVATEQTKK